MTRKHIRRLLRFYRARLNEEMNKPENAPPSGMNGVLGYARSQCARYVSCRDEEARVRYRKRDLMYRLGLVRGTLAGAGVYCAFHFQQHDQQVAEGTLGEES